MKTLLRTEELLLFGLTIFLFAGLGYSWWIFAALLLVPDLSMAAYAGGPRVGALVYNLVHHKGLAIGLYLLGHWLGTPGLQLAGVVLLGHSSLDRVFGYGLKYPDAFRNTHLGTLRGPGH